MSRRASISSRTIAARTSGSNASACGRPCRVRGLLVDGVRAERLSVAWGGVSIRVFPRRVIVGGLLAGSLAERAAEFRGVWFRWRLLVCADLAHPAQFVDSAHVLPPRPGRLTGRALDNRPTVEAWPNRGATDGRG